MKSSKYNFRLKKLKSVTFPYHKSLATCLYPHGVSKSSKQSIKFHSLIVANADDRANGGVSSSEVRGETLGTVRI